MPLTTLQDRVAQSLGSGQSITAAARAAGVHRSTIHDWLHSQPSFQQAIDDARADFSERFQAQASELAALALETVRNIMLDPKVPASARLKAAFALLDNPQWAPHARPAAPAPPAPEPESESDDDYTGIDHSAPEPEPDDDDSEIAHLTPEQRREMVIRAYRLCGKELPDRYRTDAA